MRQLLCELLSQDARIEIVGALPSIATAWASILLTDPDVVTLDVELPRLDTMRFLKRLSRLRPTPVILVSSATARGRTTTLRALQLNQVSYVNHIDDELVRGVRNAALGSRREPSGPPSSARRSEVVVAIGASTGGPEALREILEKLPASAPGVLIVQHMPSGYTQKLAQRLDGLCSMRVREAADGDEITPGQVLIAPGGTHHMEVARLGMRYWVRLLPTQPVNHCRPSVDVLFDSCARALGPNGIGAILTGMGADGARGLLAMRQAGARTIAQDEASSVVFGMPKVALARGAVDSVVPLAEIPSTLMWLAQVVETGGSRRRGSPS